MKKNSADAFKIILLNKNTMGQGFNPQQETCIHLLNTWDDLSDSSPSPELGAEFRPDRTGRAHKVYILALKI
jgi:hypothetical protein